MAMNIATKLFVKVEGSCRKGNKMADDITQKKIDELVTKAKLTSKLDQKEIDDAFPDTADNVDSLAELYEQLAQAGVDIEALEEGPIAPGVKKRLLLTKKCISTMLQMTRCVCIFVKLARSHF
jgi:Sigma-70 factor, region 1.1